MLAAGLGRQAQPPEAAAAVMGQPLEVDHGHAALPQGQQQLGLARAGASTQQPQRPGTLELGQNPLAVGLVAALQHQGCQAQPPRQPGDAVGAHPTAPALQPQGLTGAGGRPFGQARGQALQPRSHQGQAAQHRRLAPPLLVQRADLGPFGVVEQGQVDRAGNVALGELGRTAHIQQRAGGRQERIAGQGVQGGLPGDRMRLAGAGAQRDSRRWAVGRWLGRLALLPRLAFRSRSLTLARFRGPLPRCRSDPAAPVGTWATVAPGLAPAPSSDRSGHPRPWPETPPGPGRKPLGARSGPAPLRP